MTVVKTFAGKTYTFTDEQIEDGRITLMCFNGPWPGPEEAEEYAFWYACGWDPEGAHKMPAAPEPPLWKRVVVTGVSLFVLPFMILLELLEDSG